MNIIIGCISSGSSYICESLSISILGQRKAQIKQNIKRTSITIWEDFAGSFADLQGKVFMVCNSVSN
jgi:hypothetical protein